MSESQREEICCKCGKVLSSKNGVYFCETEGCDDGFILPSARNKAKEIIDRVNDKYKAYLSNPNKISPELDGQLYEELLTKYLKYNVSAVYIEEDINSQRHSDALSLVKEYLIFFDAAEKFEKMLDDMDSKEEESL